MLPGKLNDWASTILSGCYLAEVSLVFKLPQDTVTISHFSELSWWLTSSWKCSWALHTGLGFQPCPNTSHIASLWACVPVCLPYGLQALWAQALLSTSTNSVPDREQICNTFCFPLLSWLWKFLLCPRWVMQNSILRLCAVSSLHLMWTWWFVNVWQLLLQPRHFRMTSL